MALISDQLEFCQTLKLELFYDNDKLKELEV